MKLVEWCDPDGCVQVCRQAWLYTEPITGQFIEHPHSLWVLWNYVNRVGVRSVLLKLRSRFSEKKRNRKVFGIGVGYVVRASGKSGLADGAKVAFVASNHNSSASILCLHQAFVCPIDGNSAQEGSKNPRNEAAAMDALKAYVGWSPSSGVPVDAQSIRNALAGISQGSRLALESAVDSKHSPDLKDHIDVEPVPDGKPSAVVFGLGNYAKTAILPNIKPYITVQRVHEIDPDQFAFFGARPNLSLDTSPHPRPGLKFDAWFIAGYHHTHADLAIAAINQGAYAVIEKPLATNMDQFQRFGQALERAESAKFFMCFHKRYSALHALAARDLRLESGDAVDMHCIVYEIPLPRHHWYNWPNSGSRLISNGCHWIDYFMYVNRYSQAIDYRVWQTRGSDVSVHVRLENGAYLAMSLTDTGSQRLGVRDHIELRKGGATIKMVDGAHYEAENRTRIFRRKKVNPISSYARMYGHIGKAIAAGESGDSLESLRSSELTLILEGALGQAESRDSRVHSPRMMIKAP